MVDIIVARVTDPPARPYHRVLVDRLWPRGVRKEQAPWDEWLRDVAPSAALRRWYGHDPARHAEFRARYRTELEADTTGPTVRRLVELTQHGPLALLTATRDVAHSQAPILAEFLREVSAAAAPPTRGCPGGG